MARLVRVVIPALGGEHLMARLERLAGRLLRKQKPAPKKQRRK
jgi:hypothetical protein